MARSISSSADTYPHHFAVRLAAGLLIVSMLAVSTPAAPEVIVGNTGRAYQDARFAFLSSRLAVDGPSQWFASFFAVFGSSTRTTEINRIKIFPGPLTLEERGRAVLSAVAYDSNNDPLIGIDFEWTVADSEKRFHQRPMPDGFFEADLPGTFTVTAASGGQSDSITVTVTPIGPDELAARGSKEATPRPVSSRSRQTKAEETNKSDTDGTVKESKAGSAVAGATNLSPGEEWDSTNWTSADDPGNQTGNPPGGPADGGAGNGNFQLLAPVISLPGRGIDLALNLNYNSRVWNKSGSQMTFDIDRGLPSAPGWTLGFGQMVFMGSSGGCMIIDADGTRHGYTGAVTTWSTGMAFTGNAADGSFIDYGCQFTYGGSGSGWSKLSNGTDIVYSTLGNGNSHVYPTRITDAQGNFITITYRNPSDPQIETITDTTGRVIMFNYDSLDRLISADAPRMQDEDEIYGSGKRRTLFRLHYRQLTLNFSFASGTTTAVRNSTPWVIDSIYYPGTQTGYWFGGADANDPDYGTYYSSYGMLVKVEEHRGMNWVSGTEEQGTIVKGQMTKRALYNYPLTTLNETGRTNGANLTDAPTYQTLSEEWDGADVAEPAVTTYSINENDWHSDGTSNSPSRTITVTQPTGVISKQYSYRTPGTWTDGLVFADETIVMNGSTAVTVGSSLVSWQQGGSGSYDSPRPGWAEVVDENGHKVKTVYEYTGGRFNQIVRSCDYDNGLNKLRCASAEYENSQNYIGSFNMAGNFVSGRHIFNLVTVSKVENPDGTLASRTDYEYDNYQNNPLVNTPDVIMHKASHNPFDTGTHVCRGHWECLDNLADECPEGQHLDWVWDFCDNFEPGTNYRGNVTKVTAYADAQNAAAPVVETKSYDITGNVVKASSSCCEQTSIEYTQTAQYAYPVSQTRGAADPNSNHRITTSSTTDEATGLVKTSTDANGRTSTSWYNPETLRPVKSASTTGAYTTYSYDDAAMTVAEEVRDAGGILAGKSISYLNGIGQVRKQESYGPGVVDITETKYTKFGEVWKQSRPFRTGDPVQWSEKFYDAQRRLVKVVEPDGSETKAFYNETALPDSVAALPGNRIRVMDAWGRERWGRYDQQGRLTQVVEPNPDRMANPTGSIFISGSLLTKYTYDTVGRLTQTEQGVQFRKFKYS